MVKKTLKGCLILILLILLVETFLRVAGHLYLFKLYANNYSKVTRHNSRDVVIVCLGESSTAGLWVVWQDSYPMQLANKLKEIYNDFDIKVIVPPHVGQNTSQVANRIKHYLALYKPKLLILMVGVNNEWSLAESHIVRFIPDFSKDILKAKLLIFLDNVRVYKFLRYFYLKLTAKQDPIFRGDKGGLSLWGHPEHCNASPLQWVLGLATSHREAFLRLWRYDVKTIIEEAKKGKANILLMTYAAPIYVPVEDFVSMAKENDVLLVRNDLSFKPLIDNGKTKEYFLWDNWHPNKYGYKIIAENALEYIKKYDLLGLEAVSRDTFN